MINDESENICTYLHQTLNIRHILGVVDSRWGFLSVHFFDIVDPCCDFLGVFVSVRDRAHLDGGQTGVLGHDSDFDI